ncbi:cobyric acid synthase [Tenacibaculum finnmarkense]|uniref:cobyric acid synthase n=1 Tax=Tenacibaculum finnmarkense TaxID=2781243 RepID=UPI001EFA4E24|nr:cobyric acid synthase [Tenacibaculum finnmarkense]MCG8785190.1 cobyric acid synthase [Tenacibaculum finnmarkense]MCG8812178.1 cobyric acid synthase [Tenacibaculum finnmarkense]
MKNLHPIMLVGTGSDVGKSWITTGICRWLKQKGYNPAPFKAQNMSLNSFSTPDNLEIGRAQAVQAEACGISPSVEMNPILLKPSSLHKSQIVLHGKPIGNQTAKEYFLGDNKKQLFEEAKKAFKKLASKHNPIVMEGAGSISELNLKHRDIVNMPMAAAANACVYLIADIDKGGVFGSVYGTIELLEPWERKLIKGIIINKFRGDPDLFIEGKKKLEELTNVPVLGILPYATDIIIEEEDSVALNKRVTKATENKLNIAVVRLRYMSNYTDFQALEQEPLINVYFTRDAEELKKADVLIIPGTKNTIEDLIALKKEGLDTVIKEQYKHVPVLGICGGYQILGKTINDPFGVESNIKSEAGLGLFDIETTLSKTKQTIQRNFYFKDKKEPCEGYEIHMGETIVPKNKHLNYFINKKSSQEKEQEEGYFDGNKSWGTYLHGIFDNQEIVTDLLQLKYPTEKAKNYKAFKAIQFDKLADWIDQNLDMKAIIKNSTH